MSEGRESALRRLAAELCQARAETEGRGDAWSRYPSFRRLKRRQGGVVRGICRDGAMVRQTSTYDERLQRIGEQEATHGVR
ncbi:hypothetical protein OG824_27760 [Streptomyces prunicolor]|uniref:hypothetical protein n=1 Tax=Streptomyces prunicolor TaxID=67348 RepID=UPI0022503244|nr:hypothetical protein [Streptomyces prunicolor]MCX5239001.1 hypothetical protein [Streptomyces prunicolor]